ncbi:oligosaccharide repeat unit polymerase [Methylobacillus flagellatus]|uniref:O-antigen polymerase n=1 Tax=Methylobacillus flagellatus TaxID=405 RepID=UPI002853CEBC|nr:O-antigen polymerase [Methylobacillus flagellatus]MDR5172643.1 oligosaccharide repeat unit polymerase [Methylobacillus flagellatus]
MNQITSPQDSQTNVPWWLSPHGLCIGFLLPMILLIWGFGSITSSTFTVRGYIYLNSEYIALAIMIVLLSAGAAWMGSYVKLNVRVPHESQVNLALRVLGYIAFAAYIYWFKDLIFNPINIINIFRGTGLSRNEIGATQGITSLVNFTPIFISIYIYAKYITKLPLRLDVTLLFYAIILLTLLRVFAWAERLALIETLLPFALLMTRQQVFKRWKVLNFLVTAGPFIALPMLVLYFGAAEYFRSWNATVYSGKSDFWDFAIGRIASYYYTSLNNGAGMLATQNWPTYQFENVLNWLHKFPVLGRIFSYYVNLHDLSLGEFLTRFGDQEFNNPSGVYSVILDMGLPLGLLYFFITAFISGMLYRGYIRGNFTGVALYPIFFITLLEIFRYPYLGSSRAFTCILGMIVALIIIKRRIRT